MNWQLLDKNSLCVWENEQESNQLPSPTPLLSISRSTATASAASPVPSYTFLTPYRISTPRQPDFLKQNVSRFLYSLYLSIKCLSAKQCALPKPGQWPGHLFGTRKTHVQKPTFKQIPDYVSEADKSLDIYICILKFSFSLDLNHIPEKSLFPIDKTGNCSPKFGA